MNRKKRILFVTESHKLASGFGTYSKEVLSRLHETNKYEILELACYSKSSDFKDSKWKVVGVAPEHNEKEYAEHHKQPLVQWGVLKFDEICVQFQPDIVATYRDPWMDAYIADSVLLPFFNWVWMPTIDSAPQKTDWMYNLFNRCDTLLAYSEYGIKTLKNQTNGRLAPVDCAYPGVNKNELDIILNKNKHKKSFGIPEDSIVFGTVMRNQKRKMFPELMKTFDEFLKTSPPEISKKSYLYLHTSYPEKMGWEFSDLITELGLGSKILCTYKCRICNNYFASVYKDAITVCKRCGNKSCVFPGVSDGIDHKDLINIYNLMDLYIQYAICEGFGMPQVEAAACGVPIASIDYSAMEDIVSSVEGFPIEPNLNREIETNADRSGQNNKRLLEIMKSFANMNPEKIKNKRLRTRSLCVEKYDWDKTAKVWEKWFDLTNNKKLPWNHSQLMKPIPNECPKNLSNVQFMEWVYSELVQDHYQLYNYKMMQYIKSLNLEVRIFDKTLDKITQESVFQEFKNQALKRFNIDQLRLKLTNNSGDIK
jgi:glycosyltransferase involved in cell wall biosynthesis